MIDKLVGLGQEGLPSPSPPKKAALIFGELRSSPPPLGAGKKQVGSRRLGFQASKAAAPWPPLGQLHGGQSSGHWTGARLERQGCWRGGAGVPCLLLRPWPKGLPVGPPQRLSRFRMLKSFQRVYTTFLNKLSGI